MITLEQFYKGRDKQYAADLTEEIKNNAAETLIRANKLLVLFYADNPKAHIRGCTSGWRPPAVNAATKGAAPQSNHMTGNAIDIEDDDEALDTWCSSDNGMAAMVKIGLWLEDSRSTPRWCHLQKIQPPSGNRIFRVK